VLKTGSCPATTGFEQKIAKTAKIRPAKTPFALFAILVLKTGSCPAPPGFEQKIAKTAKIRPAKPPFALFAILVLKTGSCPAHLQGQGGAPAVDGVRLVASARRSLPVGCVGSFVNELARSFSSRRLTNSSCWLARDQDRMVSHGLV